MREGEGMREGETRDRLHGNKTRGGTKRPDNRLHNKTRRPVRKIRRTPSLLPLLISNNRKNSRAADDDDGATGDGMGLREATEDSLQAVDGEVGSLSFFPSLSLNFASQLS